MSFPFALRQVPATYVPLIERMRFFMEPEISWARYLEDACIASGTLTEMGTFLHDHLEHGVFVDAPCGTHDIDLIRVAHLLGCTTYVEADIDARTLAERTTAKIDVLQGGSYALAAGIGPCAERTEHGVLVVTVQDDILGLIAKIDTAACRHPVAIYLSGIQPDASFVQSAESVGQTIVPYLRALYAELDRVCRAGDTVILNDATSMVIGIDETAFPAIHPIIALTQKGFALKRTCPRGKVQVMEKLS